MGWKVAANTLYVLGGSDEVPNVFDTVDAAPLALDGSPQWATGPSLSVPRQHPDGVVHQGRVYAVGGRNDSAGWNVVEVLGMTPVGGIAELPALAGTSAGQSDAMREEGGASAVHAALAASVAAAVVTIGAGAWYARRRWLR